MKKIAHQKEEIEMKRSPEMPKLSDVLRLVDRNGVLTDLRNRHYHQVSYNNSRTIIRYIQSDVVMTAFGWNPGNTVVIFEKKDGLIAYSCFFDGFPSGNNYASFHWSKMEMEKAITLIKKDIWEDSNYCEDITYEEKSYALKWEDLATGKVEYTSSHRNSSLTISNFRKEYSSYIYHRDYKIFRLTSGRLRVEVDGKYFSYEEFMNIILFYRENKEDESVPMTELPKLNSWQKVLSIDDLDDEILDKLKVQVISNKMKEAA